MNELIDVALASLQLAITFVITVGVLIVALNMIYKSIDLASIAIGFGSIRGDTEQDIHEQNLYESNRKVYTYSDEDRKSYDEYLKRNNY